MEISIFSHTHLSLSFINLFTLTSSPCARDMDLPKEELEDVMYKAERVLKKVDYQSVPPLVYQLLLVAHSDLLGRVLQMVINYFNKQDLKLSSPQAKEDPSDINTADLIDEEAIGKDVFHIFCNAMPRQTSSTFSTHHTSTLL